MSKEEIGEFIEPFRKAVFDVRSPMHLATNFRYQSPDTNGSLEIYSRTGNPNRRELEQELARLEQAGATLTFSSGMAAIMSVFQLLPTGSHVIVPRQCYWATKIQLQIIFGPLGISYDEVPMSDLPSICRTIRPETRMIFVETPSNPLLQLTDLSAVADLAKNHQLISVCDNTVMTGLHQKPLSLGFDLSVFSISKAINGHSDVIGGAVALPEGSVYESRLRQIQHFGGAVLSPHDCWLTLRGLATLSQRLQAQTANAEALAKFFTEQPGINTVHYPYLKQHPQYHLAQKQMKSGGCLLAVDFGKADKAFEFLSKLKHVVLATSLGGFETTAEHRASVEKGSKDIPSGLIRISCGIESLDFLIQDFSRALR